MAHFLNFRIFEFLDFLLSFRKIFIEFPENFGKKSLRFLKSIIGSVKHVYSPLRFLQTQSCLLENRTMRVIIPFDSLRFIAPNNGSA